MRRLIFITALLMGFVAFSTQHSQAASFTVTNLNNAGVGSFRQAVLDAEANGQADTIDFAVSGTIILTADMNITTPITINGAGITLDGNNATRMFFALPGADLTISSMTFQNGAAGGGGAIAGNGGGTVTVVNSTFISNDSVGGFSGGAIATGGALNVTSSTFMGNTGTTGGAISTFGGSVATITITNSTFIGNQSTSVTDGGGAARFNGGTIIITGSTFQNNTAAGTGGAIHNLPGSTANTTITCSNFETNTSTIGQDVVQSSGTITAVGNWWGSPAGPNAGAETVGAGIATTPFLTAPCNTPVASASGGFAPDDRINYQHGDLFAAGYIRWDDDGDPALHVYCVGLNSFGVIGLVVTDDDFDDAPEDAASNTLVAESDLCRVPVAVYVLTTGEYQLNIGPDEAGQTYVTVWSGMPPGIIYYLDFNVYDS